MNFWSVAFVTISFIVFVICAICDNKNKEKVPFWLFFVIPIVYYIVTAYYKNPIDWISVLLGVALSIPFFVMAFIGKCGGADAIMVACIGAVYGILFTAVWLFFACLLFVFRVINKKGNSLKSIIFDKTQSAFIPAAAVSFIFVSIVFILIPYIM